MNDNEENEIILPVSDVEILAAFQFGRKDTGIDLDAAVELSGGCMSQIAKDCRRDLVDELSYLARGTRPPLSLKPWSATNVSISYLHRVADALDQATDVLRGEYRRARSEAIHEFCESMGLEFEEFSKHLPEDVLMYRFELEVMGD